MELNAAAFHNADGVLDYPGGWKKGAEPLADPPQLEQLLNKNNPEPKSWSNIK